MSKKDDGGPAFPESGLSGLPNGEFIYGRAGMTLRDYFAAKTLAGMFASDSLDWHIELRDYSNRAKLAYVMADAMLEARQS